MLKRRKDKRAKGGKSADEAQPERRLVNMDTFSVLDDHLDPETEMAAWFCSGMSRSEVTHMALSILENGEPGEFIVRDKKGEPNCYAMSVKSPNILRKEFLSFIIEKSPDDSRPGYVVRGAEAHVFESISKLVGYFMEENREALGVRLVEPGDYLGSFESMFGTHKRVSAISEEAGPAEEEEEEGNAEEHVRKVPQVPSPDRTLGNTYFPSSEVASAAEVMAAEYDGFGSDLEDGADEATESQPAARLHPSGSDVKRQLRAVFDDLPEGDDDADTEFGFGDLSDDEFS